MWEVNWILGNSVFINCQHIELWVRSKVGLESDLSILVRLKVKLSERGILQKVLELNDLQRTLVGVVWIIISTITFFFSTFLFTFITVATFTTVITIFVIIRSTITWSYITVSVLSSSSTTPSLPFYHLHLIGVIWIGAASAESQDQVYGRFFCNIVIAESAAIFHLLTREN